MLTSLELRDWKSFGLERNVVRFAPLTLLVGPNGSGKSNVLDALRFLQGTAFDYPLSDVLRGHWEGQREIWPGIRGAIVESARSGRTNFALQSHWQHGGRSLAHRIEVSTSGEVTLNAETLLEDGQALFDTQALAIGASNPQTDPDNIVVALRSGAAKFGAAPFGSGVFGGGARSTDPLQTHSRRRSLLGQVERHGGVWDAVTTGAQAVRIGLRETMFLAIEPSRMRDYRPENGGHLGTGAENISPLLSAMPEGQLRDVVGWLAELCSPEIADIRFDRTQLREVMMILVERDHQQISARSASDGTLRFLGLLVALLTAPRGALLVLEEPEVGLHPARIRVLAELLEQMTSDRGIQVVATTHSPTLLAHLSRGALGSVVAFGRDDEAGLSACSRLQDLPHFDTLADSRDVEHLVSTGWLERAL